MALTLEIVRRALSLIYLNLDLNGILVAVCVA